MKRYRLLKDLPTIKAGRIFEETKGALGGTLLYLTGFDGGFTLDKEKIENLDDWFEEIKEPEVYYYLSEAGAVIESEWSSGTHYAHVLTGEEFIQNLKSIGNYFKTRKEAEKHLEWLKARAVLIEDAKGFKPDWDDDDQIKFYVYYDFYHRELICVPIRRIKETEIFFETEKDAENSIEAHEKEWKIYLGVE